MTVAANLLIGSTCGNVYIVRCVPKSGTVTLKTTITAGEAPKQLLVDVENKCFYCLDDASTGSEGRLLTLSPTALGTIEETMNISTGGLHPRALMNVGKTIFINHNDSYSIVKSPITPKSTRRRRTSTLAPVTENPIAESLDVLYSISKTMDDVDTTPTFDPAHAIAIIEAHFNSESHIDATELKHVVSTTTPIIKFVHWSKENFIIGVTEREITSYHVDENEGLLTPLKKMTLADSDPSIVDCHAGNDSLYVLGPGILRQGTLEQHGELVIEKTYPIQAQNVLSLTVLANRKTAFILTTDSIISLELKTGQQTVFDISGTSMVLSADDDLLFVAHKSRNTIAMYNLTGNKLGQCNIQDPAGIVHMS